MHIKVDLIANKLGLKFYNPCPQMGNVNETNKSHGKRLVEDPKAKRQSGKDQDMSVESSNGGGMDHGQAPTQ